MNDKYIKIHFDKKVFMTFLGLFLIGIVILYFNYSKDIDCKNVNFDIITKSYTTADLIEFKSTGESDFSWEWDFGDKSEKQFVSDVIHKYNNEGKYQITLRVNNQCVLSKEITIKKEIAPEKFNHDLIPKIVFPEKIETGELVSFECTSDFANKWEWRFGESGRVDGISSKANYTFKKAGFHKISLVVNDDIKHALIKEIIVLPKKQVRPKKRNTRIDRIDEILVSQIPDKPIEKPEKPISERKPEKPKIHFERRDVIKMLKNYAAGKIDYADISHNFCTPNIKIIGKKTKRSDIKTLLRYIRGKKIDVKNVTILKDLKTGCVKVIFVDMDVKKGLFWRKY